MHSGELFSEMEILTRRLPKWRLFTERDKPHVRIGDRVDSPRDIGTIEEAIASIWQSSKDTVASQGLQNCLLLTGFTERGN